jgi:transcriptional regulator with XRE-family HTH domain
MTKGERLRHFREEKGLNQTQISKVLNIPPRNWSRYETDKTSPPQEVLSELAKIGLNIHWYITGVNEGKLTNKPVDAKFLHEEANILTSSAELEKQLNDANILHGKADLSASRKTPGIPLVYEDDHSLEGGIVIPLLENAASAGYGADLEGDDAPVRYVQVPRHLAKYPHLASLPVKGDSMEPTLHDGDLVVCDGGGWDGDGIYVLKTFDTSYVKRVQMTSKGYEVISDNKMYKSITESIETLSIVGKVRAILVIVPGRRGGV